MITLENWNYCYYQQDGLRSMISFIADSEKTMYSVTSFFESTFQDQFQQEDLSLEEACQFINTNFSDWKFMNPLAPNSKGCSSCGAHS